MKCLMRKIKQLFGPCETQERKIVIDASEVEQAVIKALEKNMPLIKQQFNRS